MPAGNSHYVEYVLEQLAALRSVTSKPFFGGIGLSADGIQFAMVMGSVLYFVVNDVTRRQYEKMGSACFSYSTKRRQVDVKKYYTIPADVIEDQEALVALARESIKVADAAKVVPAKGVTVLRAKRAGKATKKR